MPPPFHKHIRLAGHDYTQGAYFVTLCAQERSNILGRITGQGTDAGMELNDAGRIVDACWRGIPDHFPHARTEQMQIMPDHLHAIILLAPILSTRRVDATDVSGTRPNGPPRGSLGAIIAAFKSETTKRINRLNGTTGRRIWQPGYYERIIRRDDGEQERIAQYIAQNPANWR